MPLRLTRIAAEDDLEMRVFYLGDARAVPSTYRHVLVNEVMIDWANQASNYREVISAAADEEYADGRAFVTEYAGPTSIVTVDETIFSNGWRPSAFDGIVPEGAVEELERQGPVQLRRVQRLLLDPPHGRRAAGQASAGPGRGSSRASSTGTWTSTPT